jgi:hypothetical protein
MRLSHTALTTYTNCPEMYRLKYQERLAPIKKNAALFFGSAIDKGLNCLLDKDRDLEKAIKTFENAWLNDKDHSGNIIDLSNSLDIVFAAKDYEPDFFTSEEQAIFDEVIAQKKSHGWDELSDKYKLWYNRFVWQSLKYKGRFLLEAYYDEILPHLKSVISFQKEIILDNGDGDQIVGYIDLIAELNDGSYAILDNKTTADLYELDSVKKSEQLALYKLILNTLGKEKQITKAGFLVLSKKLSKLVMKTCQTCGHTMTGGQFQNCNALVNDKRCNGKWQRDVIFKGKTQFIIDSISEEFQDKVLDNVNDINAKIKSDSFGKNKDSCFRYGKCDFYNVCYNNDYSQVVKLPERQSK